MQQLIQVDKKVFQDLVEEMVSLIREKEGIKEKKWIDGKTVMDILHIRSRSTLQRLRDEGKIKYSQMERNILYDRHSLMEYIEKNAIDTF